VSEMRPIDSAMRRNRWGGFLFYFGLLFHAGRPNTLRARFKEGEPFGHCQRVPGFLRFAFLIQMRASWGCHTTLGGELGRSRSPPALWLHKGVRRVFLLRRRAFFGSFTGAHRQWTIKRAFVLP